MRQMLALAVVGLASACYAESAGVRYGETLRDRSWMWGHQSWQVDGKHAKLFGLDVAKCDYPMVDGARSFGLENLNVIRWDMPDRGFRDSLKGMKRLTWPLSGCEGEAHTTYAELGDWTFAVAEEMENVTGFELDDYFIPKDRTPTLVRTPTGCRPACPARFSYEELLALKRRMREFRRPLELRLVVYDDLFRMREDPRDLLPAIEAVDAVTYWIWKADDLPKLKACFADYRKIAPTKPTYLGVYLWDFGGAREMPVSAVREQLETGLDWFRRGEIEGFVFLCSSICNRPYPAVAFCRDWLARHGDERWGGSPGGERDAGGTFSAPAKQTRADVLWTRPICVEKDRYIGWPTVCRRANGELLAVFSGDRDGHLCPWGKVQLVRSTDDGEAWTEPVTIANGMLDDRDAGIVEMPDGELLVSYFTSVAFRRPNVIAAHPEYARHDSKLDPRKVKEALGYWIIRSKDGGLTWSEPEKASCDQTPHGPILLRDGSLFQLGRRFGDSKVGVNEYGRTIVSSWRSTDAGRTWECLNADIPLPVGGTVRERFHEPHAVERADGVLVGHIRHEGSDNYMFQIVSKDGGRTWSAAEKTTILGFPPHLLRLDDGRLLCTYGRRFDPGFGEFAAVSDDGGKTWDTANEICLARSHCEDLGYPSTVGLGGDLFLTVYYQQPTQGRKPCLMATKWRLAKTQEKTQRK